MLTPQTLQVHILDFSKANSQLTESLNKLNNTNKKYHFSVQHFGLIDINNRFVLISPQADIFIPQINDIKNPQVLFELDFFEEIDNGLMLVAEGTANLTANDIEQLKTNEVVSLQKFMRENFNSSVSINKEVNFAIDYVNSPSTKKYILS